MSDTIDTTDPLVIYLRERIAQLDAEIAERQAYRAEAERTLAAATDGRSRVNRKRRLTGADRINVLEGRPPATQPEPYDDSVSLDEAQGVLVRQDGEAVP
jgi:hypothetical protein